VTAQLGWEAIIGLGHESTWGTPVARTRFIEKTVVTGGLKHPLLDRETIKGRSPVTPFRGAKLVDGSITSELLYEGWEDLFYHFFGKKSVSTVDVTAQIHNFLCDDTLAMPVGLTVEVKYGSVVTELWEGCKVESVQLVADIDKVLKATFRLVGQDISSTSPTSPTYPAAEAIIWNQIVLKKDTVSTPVVSLDLTMSNNYKLDRRALGNVAVLEHIPGRRSCKGKLVADFENVTAWKNSFTGDTTHELQLQATGGIIAGSSPARSYEFRLTLPQIKIEAFDSPVNDDGIIRQEIGFAAHKAASELAILVITNLRATVP